MTLLLMELAKHNKSAVPRTTQRRRRTPNHAYIHLSIIIHSLIHSFHLQRLLRLGSLANLSYLISSSASIDFRHEVCISLLEAAHFLWHQHHKHTMFLLPEALHSSIPTRICKIYTVYSEWTLPSYRQPTTSHRAACQKGKGEACQYAQETVQDSRGGHHRIQKKIQKKPSTRIRQMVQSCRRRQCPSHRRVRHSHGSVGSLLGLIWEGDPG